MLQRSRQGRRDAEALKSLGLRWSSHRTHVFVKDLAWRGVSWLGGAYPGSEERIMDGPGSEVTTAADIGLVIVGRLWIQSF